MTFYSLNPDSKRLMVIVQSLNFGRIERLLIRNGEPCFKPTPRIVEEVKLSSESVSSNHAMDDDFTIRTEFENLFLHLNRLRDGYVDIEIRHFLPFRLIIDQDDQSLEP